MSLFDDDTSNQNSFSADSNPPDGSAIPEEGALPASPAPPPSPVAIIPEDLRISWSWAHFLLFLLFSAGVFLIGQIALGVYLISYLHISVKQIEANPAIVAPYAVAMQVVLFAFMLLFLYVTIGLLRDAPFWRSVGWKKFEARRTSQRARVWRYLLAGAGLSVVVNLSTFFVHPKGELPIEMMFKDRSSMILLMLLAVLVAPLVEETVFRGYLYPLLARSFGVPAGVLLTGVLFGLLHGAQLGWTWSLVAILSLVGVIFTHVRARTGTFLSSFLLHLGYNSLLAISTLVAMRGLHHG